VAVKLLGFDREARLVDRSLRAAERGAGSILLVEGSAGTGRSTLLMNAALMAQERGFAAASSVDRPTLYFADRSVAELPSSLCVLPALGADAGLSRLRTWLTGQQEAWRHGAGMPMLVTVDDADELPSASVAALAALPTQYARHPVVWLFARRSGAGGPEVQRLFSLYGPEATRIQLAALDSARTRALVAEVACDQPAPELLALAGLAGGNRLLLVELVSALVEEHGDAVLRDRARLRALRLPNRLRAAVAHLLGSVSARCRHLLRVVALADDRVSVADLAALLNEPFGAVVSLISEAVDAGMLADDVGDLVFAQELTRRVLAAETPSVVARQLAREIAGSRGLDGTAEPAGAVAGNGCVVPLASRDPAQPKLSPVPHTETWFEHLTDSQRTVVALVGEGLTNQQIANRLYLSPHTVNYHLRTIFRRLAIHSRVELATLLSRNSAR
jgi:DNA-binding CsgD family transcriptional regulator